MHFLPALLTAILCCSPLFGFTVDFDTLAQANGTPIPQNFGANGPLSISYSTLNPDRTPFSNQMLLWNSGYADLNTAGIADRADGIAVIQFDFGPGNDPNCTAPCAYYEVHLQDFQLGAMTTAGGLNAAVLEIRDLADNLVLDLAPFLVSGSTADVVAIDKVGLGLKILVGSDSNIGINKINYQIIVADKFVPEPSTWVLIVGGLGVVGLRGRRRSAKCE